MVCPFCGKEAQKGVLSGDGRCRVRWKAGDRKADFWDALSGSGQVTAVQYTLSTFTAEAYFCSACRKMIIETDVEA